MSLAAGGASELPSWRRRRAKQMPALSVKVADDVDIEARAGQHNARHFNTLEGGEAGRLRKAELAITVSLRGGEEAGGQTTMLVARTCSTLPRRHGGFAHFSESASVRCRARDGHEVLAGRPSPSPYVCLLAAVARTSDLPNVDRGNTEISDPNGDGSWRQDRAYAER